ncbi:MAG: DoxX family protein [Bacteroidales bacterium]|nr:DoxX family protein [Bacteroidales bacterium]
MKFISIISRLVVGMVFTFSGFVKCIDPLGTAYKISDYFLAFNLDGLTNISLVLSISLSAIELLIGLMLLFNTITRVTAWISLIFMLFYTPLTFYLVLTNPVSDCGCFGDAIILTNWQTFLKNLLLIIFVIILFINRNLFNELFAPRFRYIFLLILMFLSFGFGIWSYNHIPVIDFRPFKIGNNIQEGMVAPAGSEKEIYESTFYYKKDGKTQAFTIDNLPTTNGWEFVDRKDRLLQKGYVPPIHNFNITSLDGIDVTDKVLNSNYTFLLIAYDLEHSKITHQTEINDLAEYLLVSGYDFMCITSASDEQIQDFQIKTNAPYPFFRMDPVTLKTIIRSNPGLVMLKRGTILNKWHHKHLPTAGKLNSEIQTVVY